MTGEINRRDFLKKSGTMAFGVAAFSGLLGASMPAFAGDPEKQAIAEKSAPADALPVETAIRKAIHESREFKEFTEKCKELESSLPETHESYRKLADLQAEFLEKVLDALAEVSSSHFYQRANFYPTIEGKRAAWQECIRRFPSTRGARQAKNILAQSDEYMKNRK
ncbi:MAG: twin-arginine translocation signal domain-containing protein [Armatimonadetes bacterium]|nr:twin-arginine translocation signal domain-containing protein [Armatimonadota bacterium]NIM24491.1 twin-arginine translocation signal domain-containing protein [Armatimonadota bacterium]NIM68362.1 twin-arginine translocation signal domain-containing protein [Armatimonadota bacterium]NIM76762.1 twin-arginine translocation signal domain-containing protein [Armatimonadota bacterium]NIN06564.1 twin-arginine translocation signal domain-containing protein [Armatimonadota bacterium]